MRAIARGIRRHSMAFAWNGALLVRESTARDLPIRRSNVHASCVNDKVCERDVSDVGRVDGGMFAGLIDS